MIEKLKEAQALAREVYEDLSRHEDDEAYSKYYGLYKACKALSEYDLSSCVISPYASARDANI